MRDPDGQAGIATAAAPTGTGRKHAMKKPFSATVLLGWLLATLVGPTLPGPSPAAAERFPGSAPSANTVRLQEKAERAYRQGDYERAYGIWRDDLAEIGDKYAQYMVGYLHLAGEGVARDAARALAWYRLAAERGHEPLVRAMRDLEAQLGPGERAAAEAEYEILAGKYGDRKLVRRLIRIDEKRLRKRTGRVGASVGAPLTIVTRDGRSVDASVYYRAIEERLERRYTWLEGYVEFGELEIVPDDLDRGTPAAETGDEAEPAPRTGTTDADAR
jgi:hypothetical protein